MSGNLKVRIEIANNDSPIEKSLVLQDLEQDISRELQIPVHLDTIKSPKGSMSGDIVLAIELAGITLTALGLLWSILQIRFRGSITIEKEYKDGTKITTTKNNLTDKELSKELAKQEEEIKKQLIEKLLIKLS